MSDDFVRPARIASPVAVAATHTDAPPDITNLQPAALWALDDEQLPDKKPWKLIAAMTVFGIVVGVLIAIALKPSTPKPSAADLALNAAQTRINELQDQQTKTAKVLSDSASAATLAQPGFVANGIGLPYDGSGALSLKRSDNLNLNLSQTGQKN